MQQSRLRSGLQCQTCCRTICEDSFVLCIDCSWRKLQPALSMNSQHRSCISLSNDSTVWCLFKYPCFKKQYVMYAKYVTCQKIMNTICCINKSALLLLEGHLVSTYMSQSQYCTVFEICK